MENTLTRKTNKPQTPKKESHTNNKQMYKCAGQFLT